MTTRNLDVNGLEFFARDGKTFVKVVRDQAAALQRQLRDRAIGATLHVDPYQSHWLIEPWTNLSPDQLRASLTEGTVPRVVA